MNVIIPVSKELAIAAIAYNLSLGEKIKTKREFVLSLKNYVKEHGQTKIETHSEEGGKREEATALVEKFFD